jgi:hypothetical protein
VIPLAPAKNRSAWPSVLAENPYQRPALGPRPGPTLCVCALHLLNVLVPGRRRERDCAGGRHDELAPPERNLRPLRAGQSPARRRRHRRRARPPAVALFISCTTLHKCMFPSGFSVENMQGCVRMTAPPGATMRLDLSDSGIY